jgi:hypothetical protein
MWKEREDGSWIHLGINEINSVGQCLEKISRYCDRAVLGALPLDVPGALETTQVPSVAGTLARNGVLLLDELPEFPGNGLESLRQPLEDGTITLARSQLTLTFLARFVLVAAMNPCPCRHQLTQPHHRRNGWNSESAK